MNLGVGRGGEKEGGSDRERGEREKERRLAELDKVLSD